MPPQAKKPPGFKPAKNPGYAMNRRLGQAHTHEYSLEEKFLHGYRNREDVTVMGPGILVQGSQNVLTNVFQRIGLRKGYTLDGQRDTSTNRVISAFDWEMHIGESRHLRSGGDYVNALGKLQYRYVAGAGDKYNGNTFTAGQVYWIDLVTGLSKINFNFTDWWDTTEVKSELLFVNGTSQIYEWTGGVTTIKSVSNAAGSVSTFLQPGSVTSAAVDSGGVNYSLGDVVKMNTTGSQTALLLIDGVGGFGAPATSFAVAYGGSGYPTGAGQATITINGTGNGAVANVTSLSSDAGSGYLVGDTITLTGGGANAIFKVTEVVQWTGAVSGLLMLNPGTGYSPSTNTATTGGTGSGCKITVSTIGTGYIEKNGDKTWAEIGFYIQNGQRAVTINGTSYQYASDASSTFIVGITGDPSAEPIDSVAHQTPITTSNVAMLGIPHTFNNFLISNLTNQIYVCGENSRDIYVSKINDYKNYTFTSPVRLVGEGCLLTLDGVPTALVPQQTQMYISAGKDQWYMNKFTLSADNAAESFVVERLKTTAQQAAMSQAFVTKVKNYIAFMSFEKIFNTLGTEPNFLLDPQVSDLSAPIVNDMNTYSLTEGSSIYFAGSPSLPGTYALFSSPADGIVRLYNMTDSKNHYWEAPQILPIERFSIIDGDLYGHSSQSFNTYKLFTGNTDDGHAVAANATFSFNNGGTRIVRKSETGCYVEGYISGNTTLYLWIQRDTGGFASTYSTAINGNDTQIVAATTSNAQLGVNPPGNNSLGGDSSFSSPTSTPPKFRVEKTFNRVEYFEEQISFKSNGTGLAWEILAFGTNASPSSNEPTDIRQ